MLKAFDRALLIPFEGAKALVDALLTASILERFCFLCRDVFGDDSVEVLGVSLSKLEVCFFVSHSKLLEILSSLHCFLLRSISKRLFLVVVLGEELWLASRLV